MLLQSTKSLWGASGLYGAMSVVQPPSLWWLRPMQVLQQVAASEGCPLSPDAAASIAALADGDVRNAIQTLQVMFAGPGRWRRAQRHPDPASHVCRPPCEAGLLGSADYGRAGGPWTLTLHTAVFWVWVLLCLLEQHISARHVVNTASMQCAGCRYCFA